MAWVVGASSVLLATGLLIEDRFEARHEQATRQAEVARTREALLRAADNAERAHRARTTDAQREADQAAALRAFQAAEAETLRGQAAAQAARGARRAQGAASTEPTDHTGP